MRIYAKWDVWQVKLGGMQETKRALAMHSDVWQVDLGGMQETKKTLMTRKVCVLNFVWDTEKLRGYGVKQEMREAVWETLVTRKVCMRNFVWDTETKNEMEAGAEHEVAEADMPHRENLIRKIVTMLAYFIKFLRMPMRPLRHTCALAPVWRSQRPRLLLLGAEDMPHREILIRKIATMLQMTRNKVEACEIFC